MRSVHNKQLGGGVRPGTSARLSFEERARNISDGFSPARALSWINVNRTAGLYLLPNMRNFRRQADGGAACAYSGLGCERLVQFLEAQRSFSPPSCCAHDGLKRTSLQAAMLYLIFGRCGPLMSTITAAEKNRGGGGGGGGGGWGALQ